MSLLNKLSYGVALASFQDNEACGDNYLVKELSHSILIGIVDGIGHGDEAALASKKVIKILKKAKQEELTRLVYECHRELLNTRGVVMFLALLHDDNKVSWLGIGNIAAVHWQINAVNKIKSDILLSQQGIVGLTLPNIQISQLSLNPKDTLIFTTDGIFNQFSHFFPPSHVPSQIIADEIIKKYRNPKDDALVLVARWAAHDREIENE